MNSSVISYLYKTESYINLKYHNSLYFLHFILQTKRKFFIVENSSLELNFLEYVFLSTCCYHRDKKMKDKKREYIFFHLSPMMDKF